MLWFLLGLFLGGALGFVVGAMLAAAASADRELSAESTTYWELRRDRERG